MRGRVPVESSSAAMPPSAVSPTRKFSARASRGVRLEAQTRRHDADDFARYDPTRRGGVTHLFADRDLLAVTKKHCEIASCRMMRDAGHRDLRAIGVRSTRGQRDVEDRRCPTRRLRRTSRRSRRDGRRGIASGCSAFARRNCRMTGVCSSFRVVPRAPMNGV